MSNDSKLQQAYQDLEWIKEKNRISNNSIKLQGIKTDQQLKELEESNKDSEIAKNSSIEDNTEEYDAIENELLDTFKAAKEKKIFISEEFNNIINFYRGNIITVYAHSGGGKSSLVANIVSTLIDQYKSGKAKPKILIISNEEMKKDVYGRIACQLHGLVYKNIHEFDETQQKTIAKTAKLLSKHKIVSVIDDNWKGTKGSTTTPEGLEIILEKVINSDAKYDVIILDYFQGIYRSKTNGSASPHEAQLKATYIIDNLKDKFPCPIVVLAQIRKNKEEEDRAIYDHRHIGSKSLYLKTTDALEMVPNYESNTTEFIVQKSRFGSVIGNVIEMGFYNGKFIKKDLEFIKKVYEERKEKEDLKFNESIGYQKEEVKNEGI